jgi:hypothetical protein
VAFEFWEPCNFSFVFRLNRSVFFPLSLSSISGDEEAIRGGALDSSPLFLRFFGGDRQIRRRAQGGESLRFSPCTFCCCFRFCSLPLASGACCPDGLDRKGAAEGRRVPGAYLLWTSRSRPVIACCFSARGSAESFPA